MINIRIDGRNIQTEEGRSVLEAALNADIYIPHLCHHPDLPDIGVCGLCVVEYQGEIVSSCTLKAQEGMIVKSKGERIEKRRRMAMKLLLAAHPEDCSTCPVYGNCELEAVMQQMGVSPEGLNRRLKPISENKNNPLIEHDMTRCILCGRCVRVCHEVRGVGIIDYQKKANETYIGTPEESLLIDEDCRFCGACIEVCPTGAIRDKFEENNPNQYKIPCKNECPAGTNIPEYIRLVKEKRYEEASALIHEKLPIPKSLGHICSHPCEEACKRECLNEAISIRNIKLTAVENDKTKFWKEERRQNDDTGKTVAVVGAGPAGLTAAYYLRKQGHEVTIFEERDEPGGMLRYGIPEYRLPKEVIHEEVADLQEVGFDIKYNKKITDYSVLAAKHDAVVIAIGCQDGVRLPIKGKDLQQVYANIEFLRKAAEGTPPSLGDKVLVLGGGNVAFDCARTAVRLGAEQVEMACLENEETIPGDEEELTAAAEEGIQIHFSKSFLEIIGNGNEVVQGVRTIDVESMEFDENGKLNLNTIEGSEEIIKADTIIFATGQRPEMTEDSGLDLVRGNYINVSDEGATNIDRVFAAGDVTYGTDSVVKAVASGRNIASTVDRELGGDGIIEESLVDLDTPNSWIGKEQEFGRLPRIEPEMEDVETRKKSFMRVEKSYTLEQACKEAQRCLQCHLREDLQKSKIWDDYCKGEEEQSGI